MESSSSVIAALHQGGFQACVDVHFCMSPYFQATNAICVFRCA